MSSAYQKVPEQRQEDKLTYANKEVEKVTMIMHDNLNKVIERGEQLEVLAEKTEQLEHNAGMFRTGATDLKRMMCRRNCCLTLVILGIIIFIILIIVLITKPWK